MTKKVFITGATSGFGRATAEIFARHGHDCIISGRREERLDELQKELEQKFNVAIYTLCFDVRNKEEVDHAISTLPPGME